ncbi:cell division protein FtsQ/DivIB [Rhodovulum strictum]|uniref:Cell division protein FtsQ n=1 Tax=Rhodovulum strictum TaxID=58314 RepID=A0A844B723_9RHOB|nr:cell division protein FtsQ/DivIB [Rhodovulum strictum]MRH21450.1 cell division protein FtsQ [Rhodovulum strictum]
MCAVILPPRDPAPSRLTYRMQRLWLTPLFRLAVLRGLPLAAVLAIPALWFSDADRRAEFAGQIADIRRQVETRPEFMVKLMVIEGATDPVAQDIREVLPLDFPVSSFDLDLHEMRRTAEALDAVETAELRVRPGGLLELKVVERVPAVVWRGPAGLELLDGQGNRVAPIETRGLRADLPLIAGEGAQRAVPEALALVAAAAPIEERLRGLVRVGERRWDVVLDRNQRILLPGQDAVAALERVIALDGVTDMLGRDIAVVDLRNPGRPTVRLAPDAVEEFRTMRRPRAGATRG